MKTFLQKAAVFSFVMCAMLFLHRCADAQQLSEEEIAQFKQDFESVKGTMGQAKEKAETLKEKFEAFENYMKEGASKDIKKAAKVFNLSAPTEKELKNKAAEIHHALVKSGISGKLGSALKIFEKAEGMMQGASDIFEFAEKWDPKNYKKKPTAGLRRIAELLDLSADLAETIPIAGTLYSQMVKSYAELSNVFADKLDKLEEDIKKFRQGNLCAMSSMYKEEQACFAASESDDDCASYFEWEMFPELHPATVFEHAEYKKYFFYFGGECAIYNGGYFDQCYKYSMLFFDEGQKPDEFFVNQFGARIKNWGEKQTKLIEEAKNIYTNILKLKADSAKPIFKFLGYVNEDYVFDSPYDAYAKMDVERFTAQYLFKTQARADMEKIKEAYENHVYWYGSVRDFDDDKNKIALKNVEVQVSGTTAILIGNKYYAVVQKDSSGFYALTAKAEGYEKFEKKYPSSSKSKSQIIYLRKPKPEDKAKTPDKQTKKKTDTPPSGNVTWIKGYYSSGKIRTEIPMVNGKINGIEKIYYESGKIERETPYVNGKLHGTQKIYNSEGKIYEETPYVNDKINGTRKKYHSNGVINVETPFVNGIAIGTEKWYGSNGKLTAEIPYIKGWTIHGIQKHFTEDGDVIYEKYYENGKLVKERNRYRLGDGWDEWKEQIFK